MRLKSRAYTAPFEDLEFSQGLAEGLATAGHLPLIYEAQRRYNEVFDAAAATPRDFEEELRYSGRRVISDDGRTAVAGDFLYAKNGGILYFVCYVQFVRTRERRGPSERKATLEVGYTGPAANVESLEAFRDAVTALAAERQITLDWAVADPKHANFVQLQEGEKDGLVDASCIDTNAIDSARLLERSDLRELALVLRKSGGVLAGDLIKADDAGGIQRKRVEELEHGGLMSRAKVVICRQTSKQVLRGAGPESIDKLAELSLVCSCGRPISDERIEELLAPTSLLKRMMDQSYWTTVRLVEALRAAGVPNDDILLNLREGSDEVDAFVNFGGSLIMFELKDSEFAMGHAYPFGGRIGLYKPSIAVMVSTRGIAPEVKEYFKKNKPQAELVYVGALAELEDALTGIIQRTLTRRLGETLAHLEIFAVARFPVSNLTSRAVAHRDSTG